MQLREWPCVTPGLPMSCSVMDELKQKPANVRLALILGAVALGILGLFFWSVAGGLH